MFKKGFVQVIGRKNYLQYVKFLNHLYLSYRPFKAHGSDIIEQHLIRHGDVVLDVGANIGRFTGFAARLVGKTGKIYSFEPVTMALRVLKTMVQLRRLHQVAVVEAALSHEIGTADITIPLRDGWMPLLPIAHLDKKPRQGVIRETVRIRRLDEFCAVENLVRVDFIKCDTEGHEYFICQGGMDTLAQYRPTVFCEIHNEYLARYDLEPTAVFEVFTSLGYRSYLPLDQGRLLEVTAYQYPSNYIFIHPSKQHTQLPRIINGEDK